MYSFRGRTVVDLEVDGVDPRDYPEFADAYVSWAHWADTGEPLNDQELDEFSEQHPELAAELAFEQCIGFAG